jgi:hypothetical protein
MSTLATHVYGLRPRSDKRGVDLIFRCATLPCAVVWRAKPVANAIGHSKFLSRSHDAVIRVYDNAGNVIETHEHTGAFKEW